MKRYNNRFSEPAQNWNERIWRSNLETYMRKQQTHTLSGAGLIEAFVNFCIAKISPHGCKPTINHLQLVRSIVGSDDAAVKNTSPMDLEVCLDFLTRFQGVDVGVDELLAKIQGVYDGLNSCVVGDGEHKVNLEFNKISGLPFDYCEIKSIVNFKGMWFVLAGRELWSSADGCAWATVSLPQKSIFPDKMKVLGGRIVLWGSTCLFGKCLDSFVAHSMDGKTWSVTALPYYEGHWIEIFHNGEEFYKVEFYDKKFSYQEEGLLWGMNQKEGRCGASAISTAESPDGPWQEETDCAMGLGRSFYYNAFYAGHGINVGLSSMDSLQARKLNMANESAKFVYSVNKGCWQDATLMGANGLPPGKQLEARFCELGNVLICYVYGCSVYYSTNGGVNWLECDINYKLEDGYLCGNGELAIVYCPEKNLIYVSHDGRRFAELPITQNMDVVCLADNGIAFADKSPTRGGLFLGRMALTK